MEGKVIISLDDYQKMKEESERKSEKLEEFATSMSKIAEINSEQYNARLLEIDDMDLSEKQLEKEISKAMRLIEIRVDANILKEIIKKYGNLKQSDAGQDIKKATRKELETIRITLV